MHISPERAYRNACRPRGDETAFQVVVEHSDLWIVARCDESAAALEALRDLRSQLKNWIHWHPEFATSFSPLPLPEQAPTIVLEMCLAARRCGVGPMAAVAGAVAEHVAAALAPLSSEVLVENGGDLYLRSSRERLVGLLPDPESGTRIGLRLEADAFPLSLCGSSATIGHSVSLGKGELVVVRSTSGAFADAAATALCNLLETPKDLDAVLRQARTWAEPAPGFPEQFALQGVFAQCKGQLAVWGEMELAAL